MKANVLTSILKTSVLQKISANEEKYTDQAVIIYSGSIKCSFEG